MKAFACVAVVAVALAFASSVSADTALMTALSDYMEARAPAVDINANLNAAQDFIDGHSHATANGRAEWFRKLGEARDTCDAKSSKVLEAVHVALGHPLNSGDVHGRAAEIFVKVLDQHSQRCLREYEAEYSRIRSENDIVTLNKTENTAEFLLNLNVLNQEQLVNSVQDLEEEFIMLDAKKLTKLIHMFKLDAVLGKDETWADEQVEEKAVAIEGALKTIFVERCEKYTSLLGPLMSRAQIDLLAPSAKNNQFPGSARFALGVAANLMCKNLLSEGRLLEIGTKLAKRHQIRAAKAASTEAPVSA